MLLFDYELVGGGWCADAEVPDFPSPSPLPILKGIHTKGQKDIYKKYNLSLLVFLLLVCI